MLEERTSRSLATRLKSRAIGAVAPGSEYGRGWRYMLTASSIRFLWLPEADESALRLNRMLTRTTPGSPRIRSR